MTTSSSSRSSGRPGARGGAVLAALVAAWLACSAQAAPPPGAPATIPPAIDISDSPTLGPADAPVTVVEFADFQCPYCAQGARALRKVVEVRPGVIRWIFKNFPLRAVHPTASFIHEAALAAGEQGKFWEMHHELFRHPGRAEYDDLLERARAVGLDIPRFTETLESRRMRPRIKRDLEEAYELHLVATPTYFINGRRVIGSRTVHDFLILIDEAAAAARRPAPAPAGSN
jgi:protein-disulfide isomerase